MIGTNLGPYRILERLGRGGMATVYKAYQPSLDRFVAVKVLPPHLTDAPGYAERFEREARAVAKLEHPHILPVYDYGQEGDLTYIVMRYVEGGTLKDLLGEPLELGMACELVGQIAEALDHAHEHGVVHRDVKPSNVLLDRTNWVLLTDFGVARIVEATQQITGTGVGVGTPAYMSPEQGQGMKVDRRSDVYSLGVVLYEMLTGRVPYEADTPLGIVWKHVNDPLPLPRRINPEIPESVELLLLKAMAKAPEDRFQSMAQMSESLPEVHESIELTQRDRPLDATLDRDASIGIGAWLRKAPRYIKWAIPAAVGIAGISIYLLSGAIEVPIPEQGAPPGVSATSPPTEGAAATEQEESSSDVEPARTETVAGTETPLPEERSPVGSAANPIKVLLGPLQEAGVAASDGKVMTDWLTEATGLTFEVSTSLNLRATVDALCDGSGGAMAIIRSEAYVLANNRCGVEVGAAIVRFGYPWSIPMFLVPRSSDARTVDDLRGLTWGIPSYASAVGYLHPSVTLARAGVEADEIIEFDGHPPAVQALYDGEVDFATTWFSPPVAMDPPWQYGDAPEPFDPSTCILDESEDVFCGGIRAMDARTTIIESAPDVFEKLRILELGSKFPHGAVAFSSGFSDTTKQEVIEALIAFGDSEACHLSVCEIYFWGGFDEADDSAFDPFREMMIIHEYSESDILGE